MSRYTELNVVSKKEAETPTASLQYNESGESRYSKLFTDQEYEPEIKAAEQIKTEPVKKQNEYTPPIQYEALKSNADFADKSKYVTTYNDAYKLYGGFSDPVYDAINKNTAAMSQLLGQNVGNVYGTAAALKYDKLTDDQIANYNYLYATKGKADALNYLNSIDSELQSKYMQEQKDNAVMLAKEAPILSSGVSVLMSPLQGISAVGQVIDSLDGEIDPNATYNIFSAVPTTLRQQVNDDIVESQQRRGKSGKWASFIYQTSMSILDNVYRNALFFGSVSPKGMSEVASGTLGKVVEDLSLLSMSSGAMAQKVSEELENGRSSSEALLRGVTSGLAEFVTEKIGLENWLKLGSGTQSRIKEVVSQTLAEGGEEVLSDIANTISDLFISAGYGHENEIRASINNYQKDGYSESESIKLAVGDKLSETIMSFLGGAVSGGLMAGTQAGVSYINASQYGNAIRNNSNNEFNSQYKANPDEFINEYINFGKESPQNSYNYSVAQRAAQRIASGNTLSNAMLSDLVNTSIDQYINEQVSEPLVKKGISEVFSQGSEISNATFDAIRNNPNALSYLGLDEDQSPASLRKGINTALKGLANQLQTNYQNDESISQLTNEVAQNGDLGLPANSNEMMPKGAIREGNISGIMNGEALGYQNRTDVFNNMRSDNKKMMASIVSQKASEIFNKAADNHSYDLPTFTQNFYAAYRAGKRGVSFKDAGISLDGISVKEVTDAWQAGYDVYNERKVESEQGLKTRTESTKPSASSNSGFDKENSVKGIKNEEDLNLIGKAFGIRIVAVSPSDNTKWNGMIKDNTIYISSDLADPEGFVFNHEITHRIQELAPKEYAKYRSYVEDHINQYGFDSENLHFDGMDEFIEYKQNLYLKNGETLNRSDAIDEICADYAGNMAANANDFKALAENNQKVAKSFLDTLKDFINKLKGYKTEYTNSEKLIKDRVKIYNAWKSAYDSAIEAAKSNSVNDSNDNSRYSVRTLKDGKTIVWVERSNISSKDLTNPKVIQKYLESHINEYYTIIESGQNVYIGKDTSHEFARSEYSNAIRINNRSYSRAKSKSMSGLGEIIETSTNRRWEKTKHLDSKDAKYGIYKYDSHFAFPVLEGGELVNVRAYDVVILINNSSDGKKYLYDLVIKKENTKSAGELLNKELQKGKYNATQSSVSADIVSQGKTSVKKNTTRMSIKDDLQSAKESYDKYYSVKLSDGEQVSFEDLAKKFEAPKEDAKYFAEGVNSLDDIQFITSLKNGESNVKTVVDTIKRDLVYNGGITFVGRTFNNPHELAIAAEVFSDPRFETFRYFFLDQDNKVVLNTGVSSMIPNASSVGAGRDANEVNMWVKDLCDKAKRAGAVKCYLLHNHPSGDPTPSNADFQTTHNLKLKLSEYGLDLGKHIVIDHNKFVVFDVDTDRQLVNQYVEEVSSLSKYDSTDQIKSVKDVPKYQMYIDSQDTAVVVYSNAKGWVTGVQQMPLSTFSDLDKSRKLIKLNCINFGAPQAIVVARDIESVRNNLSNLYKDGYLLDVQTVGGESYANKFGGIQNHRMFENNIPQERFSIPDTRYSSKNEADIWAVANQNEKLKVKIKDLSKAKSELQRELASAKKSAAYWEEQTKTTSVYKPRESDIKALTKDLVNFYGSKAKRSELELKIKNLATYLMNGDEGNVLWEDAKEWSDSIASEIIDNALVKSDDNDVYKSINRYFKDVTIKVPAEVKADITDYDKWRKQYTLKLQNEGSDIDDTYQELQDEYGSELFPDIPNRADELRHMAEMSNIAKEGSKDTFVPMMYGEEAANAKELLSQEIIDRLLSDEIRQVSPTYADKMEKELAKTKAKDQARYDALKAKMDKKVQSLRKSNEEFKQKTRERLNRSELLDKIDKHTSSLSKKLLNPSNSQHIPQEFRSSVAKVLNAINKESTFDWNGNKHVDKGEGSPTYRTEQFKALRSEYSKILEQGEIDTIIDGDLIPMLDEITDYGNTPIRSLDIEQLETIWNVLRSLESSISNADRSFKLEKYDKISAFVEAIYLDNISKNYKDFSRSSAIGKAASWGAQLVNIDMLTPQAFFHRMGERGEELFKMARNAQDKQTLLIKEASDKTLEALKDVDIKALEADTKEFTLSSGEKITLSKAQIMNLYRLIQRKQAQQHILIGGIRPTELDSDGIKVIAPARKSKVSIDDVSRIAGTLSDSDKAVADKLQNILLSISEYGNEATLEVYGYEKFTDENYWAIKTDSSENRTDITKETGTGTIAGKPMAKALKPNAKNAVRIGSIFDVYADSINDMCTYAAWLAPMEDLMRVYNYHNPDTQVNTKTMVESVFGREGNPYFKTIIADLNRAASLSDPSVSMNKLTSSLKAAAVGGNLRVIIQQPTAILRALAEIDSKYLMAGLAKSGDWDKVKEYSPIAVWKDWGNFDINTGRQLKDVILGTDSKIEKAKQWLMQGAAKADSYAWSRLWNAVELETQDLHKELEVGSEIYYKYVASRFADIIDKTQVVDGVLQRSQIMRSKKDVTKMAASFMSEPTKVYNMMLTSIYDYQHAEDKTAAKTKILRTSRALVVSFFVNALAQSIIDGLRDNDKDKDYFEKLIESFIGFTGDEETFNDYLNSFWDSNFLSNFQVENYLPFIKDIKSLLQGYDVSRMDMTVVSDLIKSGKQFISALSGGGKTTIANSLANLILQISKLTGLPVANIKRDLEGIAQTLIQESGAYTTEYYLNKALYNMGYNGNRKLFYDILFNAYINDKGAYKIIYKDMIQNGFKANTINTQLKQRLKQQKR